MTLALENEQWILLIYISCTYYKFKAVLCMSCHYPHAKINMRWWGGGRGGGGRGGGAKEKR